MTVQVAEMGESLGRSVAFVAVGSNIEPQRNIVGALTMLRERVCIKASSTFYRTEPLGGKDQPHFVNGVWLIQSDLGPARLQGEVLRPIESRLGRLRTADRFASRTIDLDLVLYNDLASNDNGLTLPHPDISRPFVHGPIGELLADGAHDIEADLLAAIRILLPTRGPALAIGEPLADLTAELRRRLV